jgi:hypothetical protein
MGFPLGGSPALFIAIRRGPARPTALRYVGILSSNDVAVIRFDSRAHPMSAASLRSGTSLMSLNHAYTCTSKIRFHCLASDRRPAPAPKGDVGPVDFDPIINSQESDVKSFKDEPESSPTRPA